MHRLCCLLLFLSVVSGLRAQHVADSAVAMIAADTVEAVPLLPDTLHTRGAVFRSWQRSHPYRVIDTGVNIRDPRIRSLADSLSVAVSQMPLDPGNTDHLYLYDMRLPLVSSGYVSADSTIPLYALAQQLEDQASLPGLPVTHFDDVYVRQMQSDKYRHWARFKYASTDPRRFRYARRAFDVPTFESHTLDSWTTAQQTRLVEDDLDIDFSQANLESTWQTASIHADKWHWKGDHTLTMQQTALSDNWYKGGDNNMSVSGEQKLTVNRYDENKITTFEAILDLKLSGYYTKADTIHQMKVSDNELSLSMKYGYKAWKKWYYSAQLYAKTPVFDYYKSNASECLSTFCSPLELNLAVGVDYQYTSPNKRFSYSLLLAPFSYDLKAVADERVNVTQYGIDEGESTLHSFGSNITSKFEWKMSNSASWSSRLYYYTTYHDIKVEFENTFSFQISRFFTARIYAYPRFDDSRDDKLEIKEMLTFGIGYQW